ERIAPANALIEGMFPAAPSPGSGLEWPSPAFRTCASQEEVPSMKRWLAFAALAVFAVTSSGRAEGLSGQYIEARTCDIWTGQCFANAEINLIGKNAVMGWKIDKGQFNGVQLDGLSVVAVIASSDTLGLQQTGPAKALLIVDAKATKSQKAALVKLAKEQGGELTKNVIAVESAKIKLTTCECENKSCAKLEAGAAHIETRCLKSHDK